MQLREIVPRDEPDNLVHSKTQAPADSGPALLDDHGYAAASV
jgi:hypothetical protein